MTHSRPAVRELLTRRGLAPRRDLGQNFVADPNTVRRIAHLAGVGPGDRVVEIGAGLGSLTLALAETGCRRPRRRGRQRPGRRAARGRRRSALRARRPRRRDDARLGPAARPRQLAGCSSPTCRTTSPRRSSPISSTEVPAIERMLVLVQREVADRLVARPGTKAYGAVSVKVAYWAPARIVGDVPASVFVPRPNVESALVEIVRRPPPDVEPGALFPLVGTAFGQRRKMLRRSLHGVVSDEQFAAAEVAPTARPEALDLAEWVRLARVVDRKPRDRRPGPGETDAIAADHGSARRRLPRAGRRDGHPRPGRRAAHHPGGRWHHGGRPCAAGVPSDERNLVARALVAVGRRAAVRITKRIPPGGGLGGGSADAAAVLRWAGVTDLDRRRRARIRCPLLPGRRTGPGGGDRRARHATRA